MIFEVCRYVLAKTNQYAMAKYQNNSYSTAGDMARQEVTLKLNAYHVTVLDDSLKTIVQHPRLYGRNKESMIWGPYLDVLAKRPTALKYSGFFQSLTEPVRQFLGDCDLDSKKRVLKAVAQTCREDGLNRTVNATQ